MKLIHLADLHLGKRVNGFSMLDDQRDILDKMLPMIDGEAPDAVLIAGDVYDKPVPPAEAVRLFDDFLTALAMRRLQVFVISGNHDSPERIAFGNRLMAGSGVHLSPVFAGESSCIPVTLQDRFGPVNFYMLPFVKPVHVRQFYPDAAIQSYTDALRTVTEAMAPDAGARNVLLTHQFVTGAARCESEELSVGGSDNVDASVFDGFDYVALGHLHGPQKIGRETLRYCGSPLKYSFSEARQHKSMTVVELGEKGTIAVRTLPLPPLHDLCELRGRYDELTARDFYKDTTWQEDYTHITLTDEEDIPDAIGRLRAVYHNLMKLDYDNRRTRAGGALQAPAAVEEQRPIELFAQFFEKQNGRPLSDEQRALTEKLIETIWEVRE